MVKPKYRWEWFVSERSEMGGTTNITHFDHLENAYAFAEDLDNYVVGIFCQQFDDTNSVVAESDVYIDEKKAMGRITTNDTVVPWRYRKEHRDYHFAIFDEKISPLDKI